MPWNLEHDRSFCEGFFMMFAIFQVQYFSLQLWHIIWHHAKVSHCLDHFWISYAHFKLYSKQRAWSFLARGWASLNLKWISDEIACCEPINDFLKKFTSIISCTCSSNLGNLLPIRQEFVFFMRDGQKGSWYTGWEIVHIRWYSIFEKWFGTNAKL